MAETRAKAIELPQFHGNSKDNISAKSWINYVETCQNLANWSDAQTANYARLALRDIAADWSDNLTLAKNANRNLWSTFKPLFEKRFYRTPTISEKSSLQDSLKQRKDESVKDFYDRVDAAHYILDEDFPPPEAGATADQVTQHSASLLAHHKCNVFMAFLAGLLEEIKGKVELKDPKTLEDLVSAAVQVEKSVVKPRKAEDVNEVSVESPSEVGGARANPPEEKDNFDVNEMKAVVNFVKAQMNYPQRGGGRGSFGRFPGRGRGRNFRRGGGQSRPFNRNANHDGLDCYYCGNRGHISTTCNTRLEDKKRGVYNPIKRPQQNVDHIDAYPSMHSKNDFTV